ncbi:MAG: hypothetical protein ACJ77Q_11870 [Gemmatimonadaceae bacterium]
MTNTPPTEIQNLIEAHVKAFNSHDDDLFFSVFGVHVRQARWRVEDRGAGLGPNILTWMR